MEDLFYGDWHVEVTQKHTTLQTRFGIKGSDSSDGIYSAIVGSHINKVSGDGWKIFIEWHDGQILKWHLSETRTMTRYTTQAGLVKVISPIDNFYLFGNFYSNDLIITCSCLTPHLNPLYPSSNPYHFTVIRKDLCKKEREI